MPEERVHCQVAIYEGVGLGRTRVIVTALTVVVCRFGLLTVAVAGTWLPLVRWAARWGVHGHAFASLPTRSVGVAWCCSA